MDQQVIIELLQLLGSQSVDFSGNPLRVKMSPHSNPQVITRTMVENRVVQCEVDGKITEFNKLSEPVRNTIGQRLRLMLNEKPNAYA